MWRTADSQLATAVSLHLSELAVRWVPGQTLTSVEDRIRVGTVLPADVGRASRC